MRTIVPIPQRTLYSDEGHTQLAIDLARGQYIVTGNPINQAEVSVMVDGEMRIDTVMGRQVMKANGKLYKQIVDENSEVRLVELEDV